MDFLPLKGATVFELANGAHVVIDRAVGWINSVQHLLDSAFYYRQHAFGSQHVWRSHTRVFVDIRSPFCDSVQSNGCDLVARIGKRFVLLR